MDRRCVMGEYLSDAIKSLRIALAAGQSARVEL
jgi:hypothetical protein